jgi:PAS domain S-box-containing protein
MPNVSTSASHRSKKQPAATERQDAADMLLDKQRLLAEAQRIAHLGSWRQERSGRIVWSDEMYRIHGVAPKEFVPSADSLQALIHPDDRTAIRAQIAAAFAGGVVAEFEFRVVRPDGCERHIIARTEAVSDVAGQVAHLTGTFQDITARKHAEAAVHEAAERYRQLFEANPHPMWIYDPATLRFLAINDAAVGRYGYPRDEFLGMSLNDILVPEDVPTLSEVAQRIDDEQKSSLWRHRLKDGRLIDMEIIAQTIDFEGRPARVVLAHDVTERRRAAQDVLDSRAALRALVQRLQSAQEDERARVSRRIHDELGQMLTSLKLDLSWLERRLSEPERALQPHALLDRTVAALVLTDQTIAAVQNLASELRPGALDHLGLAAALAQRARQFQQRSGIVCTLAVTEPLPELPPAMADDLFYICQEALTNVARHARATQVWLRLGAQDGCVRLSVEDDGIGITPAVAAAQRSLGLLGMRERALHCGGTVRFETAAPRGTVVVVQVPLGEAAG